MWQIIAAVALMFAVVAGLCAAQYYIELRKWARQCQGARIIVAHKNKVRMNHTLVQYLEWVNQLDKDKSVNGQMIYSIGGTSVSIIKKPVSNSMIRQVIERVIVSRHRRTARPPQMQEGKWTATDHTVKS